MHLSAINIQCTQICVGVPSEKVHLPPIPAPINPKCTCFHFLLIFRLTDRDSPPWRVSLAGCMVWPWQAVGGVGLTGLFELRNKVSGRRRIGLNVQCTIYCISVAFLLRIRDGSISVFLQN